MLARMAGSAPLQLVHEEDAPQQRPIEARVQHRELPLRSPGVQGLGAAGAPHGQQVAHLEDCKDDELKECCRCKGVEQRLYHNACAKAHGVHASDMFGQTPPYMRVQWPGAEDHVTAQCVPLLRARRPGGRGRGAPVVRCRRHRCASMMAWWPSISSDTFDMAAWPAVASICRIDSSTCAAQPGRRRA